MYSPLLIDCTERPAKPARCDPNEKPTRRWKDSIGKPLLNISIKVRPISGPNYMDGKLLKMDYIYVYIRNTFLTFLFTIVYIGLPANWHQLSITIFQPPRFKYALTICRILSDLIDSVQPCKYKTVGSLASTCLSCIKYLSLL